MKRLLLVLSMLVMSTPAMAMGSFWTSAAPTFDKIASFIDGVQNKAIDLCGFLPFASSLTLVYTANPTVPVVLDFAKQVCDNLTKRPQTDSTTFAMKHSLPMRAVVEGVTVDGRFVNVPPTTQETPPIQPNVEEPPKGP